MGNSSAVFRSRVDVDRAVDALAAAHFPMDTIRLVTSVDGAMTEVPMEYQWWVVWGAVLGSIAGAVLAVALHVAPGDGAPGESTAALVGASAGLIAGAMGGIGTWRVRFAVLPRASLTQHVVLVEAPEGRRSELEAVLQRNGGSLVPASQASIG